MRKLTWMLPVVILTFVAAASTFVPRGVEAGPRTPPACRADLDARSAEVARLRAENEQLRGQLADSQGQVRKLQDAEKARARKLEAALGSPMIEGLH